MARINKQRQQELEPQRMTYAIERIKERGYEAIQIDETVIEFSLKGNVIKFFPYSGWATGKGINDGRGLNNLLKQI